MNFSDINILTDQNLRVYSQDFLESMHIENALYSNKIIAEINVNVLRSLHKKFIACKDGYAIAKIAGAYAFWIAKLKPLFAVNSRLFINEAFAFIVAATIISDKIHINIPLQYDGFNVKIFLETIRYHTTSPRAMTHLFESLIVIGRLRSEIKELKKK